MADYKLPDLPSDEELGITDEDRKRLAEEMPADRPELSKEEMAALLGDTKPAAPAKKDKAKKEKAKKEKVKKSKPAKEPTATKEKDPAPRAAASEPTGRLVGSRGPLTLVFLVAVALLSSTRAQLPRPVPANAPDEVFSSARAMALLTDIARRPRPTGSPEHARVRELLVERLRGLGLLTEVQTTTSLVAGDEGVRAATVRNIVARLPGTSPTGTVLLTAHYDSRELAPGAADDGSGIVTILEALRAAAARDPLPNDVIVLFTDAEELGLLGARAFAAEHPWMRDVSVVLSFEMRGGGGPSIMFETGAANGWIVRAMKEFDPRPFANSLAYEVYARMPNDTDFTPFKEAGKQGLNFAAVGDPHVYHQATDTPERLSEATLQHHGLRALAGLDYLGRADLRTVNASSVVYLSVPLVGLVVYDAGWVLPLTGGLVLLAALATLLALRAGARLGTVAAGTVLALLGGGLSWATATGIARGVARFHPEAGRLAGSLYHSEGWYVLGTVCAVFAIVAALHALARVRLRSLDLALGAALVPLAASIWSSFAAPLAAMNLQWPTAAAFLWVVVLALLGSRANGTAAWLIGLALTLPVLVIWVPLLELLWQTLSFQILGVVAVLAAVTLHLALAGVDGLRHPNGWWAPLTATLVGAGFVGIGVLTARPSPERPSPSTLVYAFDHDSGEALWATDPEADPALDSAAIAWATARAGAPFVGSGDLSTFAHPLRAAPVAPAPVPSVARPEVVVLRDTLEVGRRHVIVGVRSRIGAERMAFHTDPGGRTRFLSLNGRAIDRPGTVAWVEHWGEPDGYVVLEADLPTDAPLGIHVVEDLLRPAEVLGAAAFARPEDLAPDVRAGSDRALFRSTLGPAAAR